MKRHIILIILSLLTTVGSATTIGALAVKHEGYTDFYTDCKMSDISFSKAFGKTFGNMHCSDGTPERIILRNQDTSIYVNGVRLSCIMEIYGVALSNGPDDFFMGLDCRGERTLDYIFNNGFE